MITIIFGTIYAYTISMDIEKLNRKHFVENDMFYRVEYGLSSNLLDYKNCTAYLEVVIGNRWTKSHNATALEIANLWRDAHPELSGAIACKVFIYDKKMSPYKADLLMEGIKPDYDSKKGIIFNKQHLN
ncbi:MAG TPA: hypothetical protein PK147_00570 [Saprospiraceae bacterium]|nr:hypothetical protein [Lewinellaceae bacterium]HPK09438.1 hypothetical protein [Saprospiraceae bacterium]HPQ20307.1 hypothetical protein [Saprospiraceae bacterium]HRX28298.1 hypothetical protein [Saprospiraceae bacterium]